MPLNRRAGNNQIKMAPNPPPTSTAAPPVPAQLPTNLPADWLTEIKQVVKAESGPKLTALILGSSVLAAVIGIGANYLSARVTGAETRKSDMAKDQRQQDSELRKKKEQAYDQLESSLNELGDRLDGTRILVKVRNRSSDSSATGRISQELKRVGLAALSVRTSKENNLISSDLADQADQTLGILLPALSHAQSDPKKISEFLEAIDLEEAQISAMRTSIRRTREAATSQDLHR